MPRVLFIHTSSILGGSEKAFLDLVAQYPKDCHQDVFFILPAHGPLERRLGELLGSSDKIFVFEWPAKFSQASRKFPARSLLWTILSFWALLRYLFKIQNFIRQNEIQIIYSNGIKCHLISGILRRFTNSRVIWHLQDFFPHISFVNLFLRLIAREPDLVIANSQSVLDDFLFNLPRGWKIRMSRVVHNSVNTDEFLSQQKVSTKPIVVSLVAMLTPWKGQEIFINAMALVRKVSPSLQIEAWIVGEEVYKTAGESGYGQQLRKLISQSNLSETVKMKGLIENVQSIYTDSDIVVHCSIKPEPFGRVIVEAMSCECAVVASRAGGVPEIITTERDGLLVEPGDPQLLADAILRLANDPLLRRRLGAEARQTVVRKFNSTQFANSIFTEIRAI